MSSPEFEVEDESCRLDGSGVAQSEKTGCSASNGTSPMIPNEYAISSGNIQVNDEDDTFQLDIQNAINLGTNSVVDISGVTHVLHIDFESKQVLAIPLKPLAEEPRGLDLETLGVLLGRNGPGRTFKRASTNETVSIVVLTKLISLLVEVPLEDVPPTLRLSQLGDRILKTIIHYEEYSATSKLNMDTEDGPLTLNVNLAVLKGTVDCLDDVTLVPVYRSYPVEDADFFRKITIKGIVDEEVHCPFCDFFSFYEGYLSQHLRIDHADVSGDDDTASDSKLIVCKKCDLTLPRDELFRHSVRKHPDLVCEQCGIMFEQTNQMRRHNERHDSRLPNRCEKCGKVYKDQYILRAHIKLVHEKRMALHECALCNKRFDRKAHLKRHMRSHTDIKPFACDSCDYRSNARGDLNKHVLVHCEPSFQCSQCDKCFTHRKSLVLHEKRHQRLREFK